MSRLERVERWVDQRAEEMAEKAFDSFVQSGGLGTVYLVYRQGEVDVSYENIPQGFLRSISFRSNLSKNEMRVRLIEAMRGLPIVPENIG